MRFGFRHGAALALALAAAGQSGAVVYYGTYNPSDTAVTHKQYFLPMDWRAPDASQSFDAATGATGYCANIYCTYFNTIRASTEFVAPSSFLAKRLIVPASVSNPYGNRRVGFSISRFNETTHAWEGLGYMQIEAGLIPGGQVLELDVPLGESGAGFADFSYRPIQFDAGQRYRIDASAWAGALGTFNWYLSDTAAGAGQSIQYLNGAPTNLAYQPAFAFTDGGDLAPAGGVPEPSAWAMMIGGFALAGMAMRARPRRQALRVTA